MFKLESEILKREFKIVNNTFFASQILNKSSNMSFVPDGNGSEFIIHFENGDEFSSKGLAVTSSCEENGCLRFVFEQCYNVVVTVYYWVNKDDKTICKQIFLDQSDNNPIEYVLLDNIGIINSKTHFTVTIPEESEIPDYQTILGQPFYIDSLFFGSEFPATDNRIVHGAGQIKYYIGKAVSNNFFCPITVMGGARSNTMKELQKAFFEYIDSISTKSDIRFQYNSWYDNMLKIDAQSIEKSFCEIEKGLSSHGVAPLDCYVVDDGWANYKSDFWSFNKKFPNQMFDISALSKKLSSKFGMWLGPRGGYSANYQFAKKIQKAKNGFVNKESKDICVCSQKYIDNLSNTLLNYANDFDTDYWKLDGFALKPCRDSSHDHAVGGENDMYYYTDLWHKWIKVFKNLRRERARLGKDLWINMTCYTNVSPWWLQWVNSVWIQNSSDIGFAENYDEQPQLEAEITYRDGRYYDAFCTRALQFPLKNIYNHEPIYGNNAKLNYTDKEFEKYLYWCAVRGQALNELYLSYNMMSEAKWQALAKVINWQKSNYNIIKNASFIGGNPLENNIYGYVSWTENGEGVIALRNPTKETASLTLTLNKLMGVPEDLASCKCYNVYNKSMPQTDNEYSYGDKIDLIIHPFEIIILKFTSESVFDNNLDNTEFSLSFNSNGNDCVICQSDDVKVFIEKGYVNFSIGSFNLKSDSIISNSAHKICLVREKNKLMKIYIDSQLDCSLYDESMKQFVSTNFDNQSNYQFLSYAVSYDNIQSIK